MGKSSVAAKVIDLEAFRERKRMAARSDQETVPSHAAVLVPVWFCWVPVWTPPLM
jgi:hypothetical protein